MESLSTSLILLLLAVTLLWLAVTDKLSRVLDAYDVITGKMDASVAGGNGHGTTGTFFSAPVTITLPSLPTLGNNAQVGIS